MINNSKDLLELVKNKLFPGLELTEDRFNFIDGLDTNENAAVEVKYRNKLYAYPMIEKHKWDVLKQYQKGIYICAFKHNDDITVRMWELHNLQEPTWYEDLMPSATDRIYNMIVEKKVGYLNMLSSKNITKLLLS